MDDEWRRSPKGAATAFNGPERFELTAIRSSRADYRTGENAATNGGRCGFLPIMTHMQTHAHPEQRQAFSGDALPDGFNLSQFGPHVQAAYRGPSPDNPSLSLKKRLSKARALDQRARQDERPAIGSSWGG